MTTTNTSSSTNNGAAWSIKAGSAKTARILSIKINQVSTTASNFALALAATPGTQSSAQTPISFQTADSSDACTATCAVSWSSAPSAVPTNKIDILNTGTGAGTTQFVDFPQGGFSLPAGKELVLYNLATNDTFNVAVEVDE